MQSPQFDAQNDPFVGDGVPPIPQWLGAMEVVTDQLPSRLTDLDLDPDIGNIFLRLCNVFWISQPCGLPTPDLHDLTIFVLHKLLAWTPQATHLHSSEAVATSQCIRYAVALYMLIVQGPKYFPHTHLQANLVSRLKNHLDGILASLLTYHEPLALWLLLVGMTASYGTTDYYLFTTQIKNIVVPLHLHTWKDVIPSLEEVLWYKTQRVEHLFQARWEEM
jgi:hypothetical protein